MRIAKRTIPIIEQMSWPNKKTGAIEKLQLWPRQHDYIEFLHSTLFGIVVKKRQVFATTLFMADSICQCIILNDFVVPFLSKSGPDAIEAAARAHYLYNSLPEEIKRSFPRLIKDTTEEMKWENGSRIVSLPVNRGEGLTGDRIGIDEAARITPRESHTDLEHVLRNVEPVIQQSGGQIFLISKASGFNQHRTYYMKGKSGIGGMKAFFFSCWDDPNFTEEERQKEIEKHGEDSTNENYPRNDTEAFLMSGNCRFNTKLIQKMFERQRPEGERGILEVNKITGFEGKITEEVFFTPNPNGWITVYHKPAPEMPYFGGFDVSEGIDVADRDTDYSDGVIYDTDLRQMAAIHCRFEPDVYAEEIRRLGLYYNKALLGVERNKDGLGVLKCLEKSGYPNLYRQESLNPDTQQRESKLGWITDKVSKYLLINDFDSILREEKIQIYDELFLNQLTTFVRFADGTVGAQDSCHDDMVMGGMIGAWMRKYLPSKAAIEKRQAQVNSNRYKSTITEAMQEAGRVQSGY